MHLADPLQAPDGLGIWSRVVPPLVSVSALTPFPSPPGAEVTVWSNVGPGGGEGCLPFAQRSEDGAVSPKSRSSQGSSEFPHPPDLTAVGTTEQLGPAQGPINAWVQPWVDISRKLPSRVWVWN